MIESILQFISESSNHLTNTVALILVALLFRIFSVRAVQQWTSTNRNFKRIWIVQLKNISAIVIIFGLVIIWAEELRNFALSLVAVAAAVAISAKELILCLMGGLYKASTRPFTIGDRIEVDGIRGDVLDHDLVATKIYEIGPGATIHQYTGRVITIPNSLFLTHPVLNEDREQYILHTFVIPVKIFDDWKACESSLLAAARKECSSYINEAKQFLQRQSNKEGFDSPNVEPRVTIQFPEADKINLVVRIPVPGLRKTRIEQAIIRRFLDTMPEPVRVHH